MENKKFGYCRCSTAQQHEFRQLEKFKELGINERDIYIDKKSGKDFDREQYQLMKKQLRCGDVVYITELSRLGRNYRAVVNEYSDITKNIKADIVVLDMPLLDTTKNKDLLGTFISDLILQILGYCADVERKGINEKCSSGRKLALERGVRFGRPKIEKPDNYDEVIGNWKDKKITAREAMRQLNLKPNTFYCMVKNDR